MEQGKENRTLPEVAEENKTTEEQLDNRNYTELDEALFLAEYTVYKRYLSDLSDYAVLTPNQLILDESTQECIRALHLKRLTCKKGEDALQKLSTIYSACMELGCALFVLIDVESNNSPAQIYLGVRNSDYEKKDKLSTSFRALKEGLLSHFPGTELETLSASKELKEKLDDIFAGSTKFISTVSTVASVRDKSKTEHKDFIQGIEKLIDGMRGHTYTALLIAEPITAQARDVIRKGYEELYTTIVPFQKSVWSYNENDSTAVMDSLSEGISKSITNGVSHTQSHTVSNTKGTTNTMSIGVNASAQSSSTLTTSKTSPTKVAKAGQAISVVGQLLGGAATVLAATPLGPVAAVAGGVAGIAGGLMQGSSITNSVSETLGKSLGVQGGFAHSTMRSETVADGTADTQMHNETNAKNEVKTKSKTQTHGTGRTLQIENVNKTIEEMLKCIEKHLERLNELEDYGAYTCGAYFLSSKQENCILAANTYQALMRGEGTGVENSAVNYWNDADVVSEMKEYLKRIQQPIFALPLINDDKQVVDYITYSAGTIVSGLELPMHLGLPTKSVEGLPVIEHAEFGRNVINYADSISLGRLSNMGVKTDTRVRLDVRSLASHTFITGSTGSGKSNTVYQMLWELKEKGKKFLVVEPAKGEYAQAFGGIEDVAVYGTNPLKNVNLLRLNPFAFEPQIHVLEHLDRLIEIFNACWPMYAAMPAILKEAMEKAYVNKGWDLYRSKSYMGEFPTFEDVVENLRTIIDSSDYSGETKGDYKGALITRVKSLTTGLYGQIFCSEDAIPDEDLFDENVIVDLSRVGSAETKTLLMGIMVLKLQEYRMAHSVSANETLRHITVLEEAHNLLRRCGNNAGQETANLRGLAVEMISNAIAEMRTYGEGFIIVDQAPGLLDMAVIRNTNTKIIMRLPDEEDRRLVGKAANLNDDQIVELARLGKGVAAIYQNEWMESILCHVDQFKNMTPYMSLIQPPISCANIFFEALLGKEYSFEDLGDKEREYIQRWISQSMIERETKQIMKAALAEDELSREDIFKIIYHVFDAKGLFLEIAKEKDEVAIVEIERILKNEFGIEAQEMLDIILNMLAESLLDMVTADDKIERLEQFQRSVEERRLM